MSLFFLIFFFFMHESMASQELDFGLGGVAAGRANGVTAEVDNGFAARYNPALISASSTRLFTFALSTANARLNPFNGVLVDSRRFRTQEGVPRSENYSVPETSLTLWALGATFPFTVRPLNRRKAGLGVAVSGPFGKIHSLSARSPYDFYSLRYGIADSQLKGTVSASFEALPEYLYLGGGLTFYMTSAGAADTTLATANPTGRMAVDVGLNSAAVAGLYSRVNATAFSLVYHQAIRPSFEQHLNGKVPFAGNDAFEQPFTATTVFYYEPHLFEADAQHDFGPCVVSVGLSYQLWSGYQPSFLTITTTDARGNRVSTPSPPLSLRNTWNPRTSVTVPFFKRKLSTSLGYEYRPSAVRDATGPANLLDTNTHVFGISVRHHIEKNDFLGSNFRWGIFGQYHWMSAAQISKSGPDLIGAPRYQISGRAYTYGLTLEAEL